MRFPSKSTRQIIPAHPQRNRAMSLMPFHLAIPVHDLPAARRFYGEVFGLSEGRSAEHWVDFDFFGHQLVIHQHPQTDSQRHAGSNPVDGHDVPVPHFGVVLAWDDWHALAERLKQRGTRFVIEPYIRFGPGRRAGHAVSLRPLRQRAGVQELPRPGPVVRQVRLPALRLEAALTVRSPCRTPAPRSWTARPAGSMSRTLSCAPRCPAAPA